MSRCQTLASTDLQCTDGLALEFVCNDVREIAVTHYWVNSRDTTKDVLPTGDS